jgi:choice-of-anchor A domain-containing protein
VEESEGADPGAPVPVRLTCPVDYEVTVEHSTADGTALAGADGDYLETVGTLVFAPGESEAEVTVPLVDDDVAEPTESFTFQVDAALGAAVLGPAGEVTVLDDDGTGACVTEPLGTANGFNVFIFEHLIQNFSDTEGRLAAGSSVQLNGYSVGGSLPPSGGTDDVLVSGGSLIFANGTVHAGNAVYATTASVVGVTILDGTLRQDQPIDFAAERVVLEDLSADLAEVTANGSVDVPPWMTLTLTGTDPVLNVFEVPGSVLSQASGFNLSVPAGSSVLVNVDGASVTLQNFGFQLGGLPSGQVLFNLHQATSVTMQSIGVEGSLLAPLAHLQFNNGVIHGSLVGRTLQGNGQSNQRPFTGCLPSGGGGE